jgi:hypothetical protein
MPKTETSQQQAPPKPANDNAQAEPASRLAPPPRGMGKLVDKLV